MAGGMGGGGVGSGSSRDSKRKRGPLQTDLALNQWQLQSREEPALTLTSGPLPSHSPRFTCQGSGICGRSRSEAENEEYGSVRPIFLLRARRRYVVPR